MIIHLKLKMKYHPGGTITLFCMKRKIILMKKTIFYSYSSYQMLLNLYLIKNKYNC